MSDNQVFIPRERISPLLYEFRVRHLRYVLERTHDYYKQKAGLIFDGGGVHDMLFRGSWDDTFRVYSYFKSQGFAAHFTGLRSDGDIDTLEYQHDTLYPNGNDDIISAVMSAGGVTPYSYISVVAQRETHSETRPIAFLFMDADSASEFLSLELFARGGRVLFPQTPRPIPDDKTPPRACWRICDVAWFKSRSVGGIFQPFMHYSLANVGKTVLLNAGRDTIGTSRIDFYNIHAQDTHGICTIDKDTFRDMCMAVKSSGGDLHPNLVAIYSLFFSDEVSR